MRARQEMLTCARLSITGAGWAANLHHAVQIHKNLAPTWKLEVRYDSDLVWASQMNNGFFTMLTYPHKILITTVSFTFYGS